RAQGYAFSDIRSMALSMRAQGVAQVTGSQEIVLDPQGKWLHTFFQDESGGNHEEWTSSGPVSQVFKKTVRCPPGWTFVAEAVGAPPGWLARFTPPDAGLIGRASSRLLTPPPLKLAHGEPARPVILWVPAGQGAP